MSYKHKFLNKLTYKTNNPAKIHKIAKNEDYQANN